jgi:hypothetical protein
MLVGCYLIIVHLTTKRTSNFEDVRAYVVIVHAIDEYCRLGENIVMKITKRFCNVINGCLQPSNCCNPLELTSTRIWKSTKTKFHWHVCKLWLYALEMNSWIVLQHGKVNSKMRTQTWASYWKIFLVWWEITSSHHCNLVERWN